MHVVAEKAGGAPLQAPRAAAEGIAVCFDFGDVVIGAERGGAERSRVRVGHSLVIHRDIVETGRAERFACRLDFLQMTAERLLALVEAEQRLKYRGVRQSSGRVLNQGIVQAMANRPLERLLQDAAAANAVELLQLGFDAGHTSRRPLL